MAPRNTHDREGLQATVRLSDRCVPTAGAHLLLGLGFLHVVSADLDSGREDGPGKLHHVHPKQMTELLCN